MNSSFLLGILLLIIAVTALDKGELREEFHRQDTNSDGLLDGDEVRLMLRQMFEAHEIEVDEAGVQLSQAYYLQSIQAYFAKFDRNGDGINLQEFQAIVQQQFNDQPPEEEQFAL